MPLIDSMQEEWLIAAPAYLTVVASLFGVNEASYEFIKRGGKVRAIIDISYQVIEPVREMIAIGEKVRHIDQHGITFVVFDRRISISAINAEVKRISLNEPVSGLWTDDPAYAQYLASTFEMVWGQSVPAELRIQELLECGPRKHKKSRGTSGDDNVLCCLLLRRFFKRAALAADARFVAELLSPATFVEQWRRAQLFAA